MSEIERGNKWPFPNTLGKIAKALKIQVHELFRDDTPSKRECDYTAMVVNELLTAQKAAADNIIKQYIEPVACESVPGAKDQRQKMQKKG